MANISVLYVARAMRSSCVGLFTGVDVDGSYSRASGHACGTSRDLEVSAEPQKKMALEVITTTLVFTSRQSAMNGRT